MSVRQLPPRSSLRQLKSQAKDLRKAAASNDATALTRIRTHHPRLADVADSDLSGLSLQDAQLVVARVYGFDSWPRLTEAVESAPTVVQPSSSPTDRLSGDSLTQIRQQIERAAATGVPVLITGEAGTGKRLVARTLQALAGGPLAEVSCDVQPGTLGEADIFGYEEGAFTGAHVPTPGKLEQVQGGTLVLDEVGHLSQPAQIRLLEAIENGSYRRLGGTEARPFNVRLVCTTSTDLRTRVESGDLRQDLYFRLQVLRIDLAPLRERSADIPALVQFFIANTPRPAGEAAPALDAAALAMLCEHGWPGNVRELRHVVEGAALVAAAGPIEAGHIRLEQPRSAGERPAGERAA